MACKNNELTEKQKVVLAAFAQQTEPVGTKVIAAASNLESKVVSCQLKALKNKGLVESPVRCKYAITATGKTSL